MGTVPRARRRIRRAVGVGLVAAIGLYFVARGILEFWVVDFSDPSSYADDWGGPSLIGVLAVHSGPGLLVIAGALLWWRQRRQRRTQPGAGPAEPPRR